MKNYGGKVNEEKKFVIYAGNAHDGIAGRMQFRGKQTGRKDVYKRQEYRYR